MSKPVKGVDAHSLGLVDAVVAPDQLVKTARQWALDILECRRPWVHSLYKTDKLEPLGEAREILKFARTQAQKQAPNLKHPLLCIDVIEAGIVSGPVAGLWKVSICYSLLLSLQITTNMWLGNGCLVFAGGWGFSRTSTLWHLQVLGPHLLRSTRNLKGSDETEIATYVGYSSLV